MAVADPKRKALGRLKSLASALGDGAAYLEAQLDAGDLPYQLIVVRDAGEPVCHQHDSFESLSAELLNLRELQQQEPANKLFAFIVRGERLALQKGPAWALHESGEVRPLQTPTAAQYIEDSGALFEPPALEDVEPSQIAPHPVGDDPANSPVPADNLDDEDEIVPD